MKKIGDNKNFVTVLYLLCFLQCGLVIILLINKYIIKLNNIYFNYFSQSDVLLIFAFFVTLLVFYYLLLLSKKTIIRQEQIKVLNSNIKNIELLNNKMRAERHDFLNHIQVIYGLCEIEEFEELRKYLDKLYEELEDINKVNKTDDIAVNALLQAKVNTCKRKNIKFDIHVKTSMNKFPINGWEACKVLSNLLDNAIFAADNWGDRPKINLKIYADKNKKIIKVTNTGKCIEKDIIKHIFNTGFTTKGDKGQGMGLSIVKEIVENHGGTVFVTSIDNVTSFVVSFERDL